MFSRISRIGQFALLGIMGTAGWVWAQTPQAPDASPRIAPGAGPEMADSSTKVAIVFAGIILLLILGVAVKLYDLKRKRDDEAVAIQARISEALMVDPSLAPLPITATVRLPFWQGSPVMIDLAGTVPWAGLRQVAADLTLREAQKSGKACRLQDLVTVDPAMVRRAA